MEVKSDYWLDTEENKDGETSFDLSANVRINLFYNIFGLWKKCEIFILKNV